MNDIIRNHLTFLYGAETAAAMLPRLEALLTRYRGKLAFDHDKAAFFDERDAVLITYGDMVQAEGQAPLATLAAFAQRTLSGVVSTIHVLPFYPYTSDDGFSVVDYLAVNPALGDWDDVARVGNGFRLMFDAVINHISAESAWFQAFLRGEAPYTEYFTVVEPGTDLSAVFRPRTLPLLTPAETPSGTKYVWTTFSADQIDLNYASPDVMLAIIDVLLSYVAHGADLIRLDAIGFMWKEIGTSCIHLPQAHAAIQLIRAVLDVVAPATILVTETNVPHRDNISYFGNGTNEAQMVYNFTLPPLTLHSFHTGDATVLSRWAATLDTPSDRATYFNFLASHDGIGVTPARGLLSSSEIDALAQRVQALGGFVSFKTNSDGSQSAYELNINYLDALGRPGEQVSADYLARRFLAAQAVMLALRGVPGIYFHSLFGSQGWPEGVAETGRARTINREKLRLAQIEAALATAGSLRQRVYDGFCRLLRARSADRAFHPNGGQRILTLDPALFAVERSAPDGSSRVLCLQNVSDEAVIVSAESGTDLLSNRHHMGGKLSVPPYGIVWLKLPLT